MEIIEIPKPSGYRVLSHEEIPKGCQAVYSYLSTVYPQAVVSSVGATNDMQRFHNMQWLLAGDGHVNEYKYYKSGGVIYSVVWML